MLDRASIGVPVLGLALVGITRYRRDLRRDEARLAASPYGDARAMAERIPGVRFLSVKRGGHALTHLDITARRAVEQFLDAACAAAPILADAQGG